MSDDKQDKDLANKATQSPKALSKSQQKAENKKDSVANSDGEKSSGERSRPEKDKGLDKAESKKAPKLEKQSDNTAKASSKQKPDQKTKLKVDQKETGIEEEKKMSEHSANESKKTAPASSSPKEPIFDAPKMPKLERPQKSRRNNGLLWFVLVLLVIAVGGIGWSTYQQHLMQKNWQTLQTDMTEQSAVQSQNVSLAKEDAQQSLSVSADNSRQVLQQAQLISQLRQALTATQERVRELSGRQQQDWLLAEAEYLIKLAEYKITLEKDKATAIGLLKTADQRVMEIADNSLLDLRQIIAKDIGNLQLVVAPDVGGISSQIVVVNQQIEALDLKALEFEEVKPKLDQVSSDSSEFSWQKVYKDFLDDFVTIKDHSEPVKPLMTPEQRGNLNANIQLALQKAQIALVRSEQTLYQNSIQEALTWVETFFVTNSASETVVSNLKNLLIQRVVIDLPRNLDSKKAIQAVNQQRLYQWLNEKPSQVGESSDRLIDKASEEL